MAARKGNEDGDGDAEILNCVHHPDVDCNQAFDIRRFVEERTRGIAVQGKAQSRFWSCKTLFD